MDITVEEMGYINIENANIYTKPKLHTHSIQTKYKSRFPAPVHSAPLHHPFSDDNTCRELGLVHSRETGYNELYRKVLNGSLMGK